MSLNQLSIVKGRMTAKTGLRRRGGSGGGVLVLRGSVRIPMVSGRIPSGVGSLMCGHTPRSWPVALVESGMC